MYDSYFLYKYAISRDARQGKKAARKYGGELASTADFDVMLTKGTQCAYT